MRRLRPALHRSFASLSVPNYRRYFYGQIVSLSGTWMQTVGELWLVLTLTGSALAVGLTTALQFTPILLFGAWSGVLADRMDKRRLLTMTQAAMAVPALVLWVLAATGVVQPWMVFVEVFARGAVNAVDNPARQSFVVEMVGPSKVVNAVGLNSAIVQSARIVGPALAGIVIATAGVSTAFLINAISFLAMIVALRRMDPAQLHRGEPTPAKKGQLRSALRYVRSTPNLRIPLLLTAVVGTLSFNFQTLLPLLTRFSFHGHAGTYAAMTTAMGVGAVVGALTASARENVGPRLVTGASIAFGALLLAAASAPDVPLELAVLVATGAASVTFAASVNSTLQLNVRPSMRGRVMALYSVVFLGSNPIGGPIMGLISATTSPRVGLLVGAITAVGGGLVAREAFARESRVTSHESPVTSHQSPRNPHHQQCATTHTAHHRPPSCRAPAARRRSPRRAS